MGDRTEDQTQQQTEGQQPANQAGDGTEDEAALWAEFDAAEKADAGEAPPEGRDAAADANGGSPDKDADQDAAAAPADKAGNAQQPTTQTDIWAAAPPELRSAFEAEARKRAEFEHRLRSDTGRIAALQRQIEDLRKGGTAPGPAAGATTTDAKPETVLASEKWKTLKQEYPEVAEPFEAILAEMEGRIHRHEKELSAIGTDRRQAAQDEQQTVVTQVHGDYVGFIRGNLEQFQAWREAQPRYVQEAIQRNWDGVVDGYEMADVIARFKSSLGGNSGSPGQEPPGKGTSQPLADRRKRQLESSASPRSRGPSVASGIPEDADEETIWKQFDEEDRRKAARR